MYWCLVQLCSHCADTTERSDTGKGLRKRGQSSMETNFGEVASVLNQCCETDSSMYSLLPVCLGSNAVLSSYRVFPDLHKHSQLVSL